MIEQLAMQQLEEQKLKEIKERKVVHLPLKKIKTASNQTANATSLASAKTKETSKEESKPTPLIKPLSVVAEKKDEAPLSDFAAKAKRLENKHWARRQQKKMEEIEEVIP